MGTGEEKEELFSLTARILKLENFVVTRNGELGIVVLAVQSLKSSVSAGEDRLSTTKARASKGSTSCPCFGRFLNG